MNTTTSCDRPSTELGFIATDYGPVVGVRTTRIYCRQTCRPGRGPKPENCIPFLNAAVAREAGYRACKQCKPDDSAAPRSAKDSTPLRSITYGLGVTPIGIVFIAATERGICSLDLLESADPSVSLERLLRRYPGAYVEADTSTADSVVPRLVTYLADGVPIDDIPLDLRGTPFQISVWRTLGTIPRGETMTYRGLALKIGLPAGSARAVGTACGSNPVSLIIPCHRVISTGGGLGGYYWGLDRKRTLLEMESAL